MLSLLLLAALPRATSALLTTPAQAGVRDRHVAIRRTALDDPTARNRAPAFAEVVGPRQPVAGRLNGPRPAPAPQTALDAERAFAADAQTIGQWAAFRKWAAIDAIMFVRQPVQALDWLRGRAEPAQAVQWWPTASWRSSPDNPASIRLHERLGFERVGVLREVGTKFGRWLDLVFMQRFLDAAPPSAATENDNA